MPESIAQATKPVLVIHKLFKSFHEGFGDADNIRYSKRSDDYSTVIGAAYRYNRTHGSIDLRWPGQLRMGLEIRKFASPAHDLRPIFAAEWADTNGIYPVIYYVVGRKIQKVTFGGNTEVGTNALPSNATGGMFDDDGSGIPYLYASFGGTTGNDFIRRMDLAQTVTASTDVVAGLMLSLNGKAYRTIKPTSGTATCQVSVCPYGSNRMVNSAWSVGTTVGFAGTDINVLTAVRNAAVAVKPEGIFVYNLGLDQWVNYTPSWRQFMHLDNGKGSYFLGDMLVVPMGDGGAVVFDGNNVRPFDAGGLEATPNKDTTRGSFSAVGAMRHWLIGASRVPAKYIAAGDSLQFHYTTDGVAFTDRSAEVRDLNLTTLATLPLSATLKVYIGWDRPFTAVRFDTGDANTTARTMTVKVGTDAATYTTVGAVNTGFRDFTSLAGASLGQSGHIVLMVDPVDSIGWVQTTINGVTAYWMELTWSGAFDSTVSWLNCQIQPWSPSVDYTNFPLDGLDKSGNFPHLLFGRQASSGKPTWHDMVSLPEPDDIGSVIFANVGGTAMNHARNLVLIGRFGTWLLQTADDDRPGAENNPFLAQYGLVEAPSFEVEPGKSARLAGLRINGHSYDPNVHGFFYYSWDYGKGWSRFGGRALALPFDPAEGAITENYGSRFRWAFGFARKTTGAKLGAPTITEIEADFELMNRERTSGRKLRTRPQQ